MTNQLPPSLQRFSAAFDDAVHAELGPSRSDRATARARRPRRGILAGGGTLGLAGVGAALVFALGSSATTPAFAVTQHNDGSVSVQLRPGSSLSDGLVGANRKLAQMGLHEGISIQMASGPAPVAGPVKCTATSSTDTTPATPVSAYVGTDNTETVPAGGYPGAGNTGAGGGGTSYHLASCTIHPSNLTPSQIGVSHQDGKYTVINEG